jgi:hypothetical protein
VNFILQPRRPDGSDEETEDLVAGYDHVGNHIDAYQECKVGRRVKVENDPDDHRKQDVMVDHKFDLEALRRYHHEERHLEHLQDAQDEKGETKLRAPRLVRLWDVPVLVRSHNYEGICVPGTILEQYHGTRHCVNEKHPNGHVFDPFEGHVLQPQWQQESEEKHRQCEREKEVIGNAHQGKVPGARIRELVEKVTVILRK